MAAPHTFSIIRVLGTTTQIIAFVPDPQYLGTWTLNLQTAIYPCTPVCIYMYRFISLWTPDYDSIQSKCLRASAVRRSEPIAVVDLKEGFRGCKGQGATLNPKP